MAFRRFVSARSCTVSFVATCLSKASRRLANSRVDRSAVRNCTKARTTKTLISTAPGLFSTVAAMMAPCSVNASGRFRVPPQLDVANCDIKLRTSSSETSKMKSAGNLCWFRRTCSLRRRVSTPYRAARSRSSSTRWPRRMTIAPEMRSGSVGGVAIDFMAPRFASWNLPCSVLRDCSTGHFQMSRLCVEVHPATWRCFQSNGSAGRARRTDAGHVSLLRCPVSGRLRR